jgi:hypothetical protein
MVGPRRDRRECAGRSLILSAPSRLRSLRFTLSFLKQNTSPLRILQRHGGMTFSALPRPTSDL